MEIESSANQPGLPPILDSMGWIQRAVLERLVGLMAQSGFTEVRLAHANLLTSIPPDTGARMGELATRLRITRGAVSQLVAELETAGILRRERHPSDGRGVVVRPTKRALRGYAIARTWTIALYESWQALAGDRDWKVFLDVLSAIAAHEQEHARKEKPVTAREEREAVGAEWLARSREQQHQPNNLVDYRPDHDERPRVARKKSGVRSEKTVPRTRP